MSKYRIKTKEEFIDEGRWDYWCNCPEMWNEDGDMNKFLGKDVPEVLNSDCDSKEGFLFKGWRFSSEDYVLKEENEINANGFEYFGDTLMEVSESGEVWITGVVFGKKNGRYVAWESPINGCSLEDAKTRNNANSWKYARPIKTKLTLEEIADKFGLDVNEIEII